jgi:type IV secretory pathway component VirB8
MMDEGGFPCTQSEAMIKELYGDLAWQDFNNVFKNQGEIVNRQYGRTITVKLDISRT